MAEKLNVLCESAECHRARAAARRGAGGVRGSQGATRAARCFRRAEAGTPGRRELAMGAIATGGVRVLNEEVVGGLGIPMDVIDAVTAEEKQELKTARTGLPGPVTPSRRCAAKR